MATRSSDRVTAVADGISRTLFSLRLTKHGDVLIVLKKALVYRGAEKNVYQPKGEHLAKLNNEDLAHGQEIIEQRYSIHPSKESADLNVIQHTLDVKGLPRSLRTRHETKAIKSKDGFAIVFARRTPNLAHSRYILDRKAANEICIGEYDVNLFTLMYMLIVSHKDKKFGLPDSFPNEAKSFNIADFCLGDFCFTILYGYLTMPSSQDGVLAHYMIDKSLKEEYPDTANFCKWLKRSPDCLYVSTIWPEIGS